MDELTEQWAPTFSCLGDPTRLRLLLAMHYRGPAQATVGELAEAAGVVPGTASAALTSMSRAGFVRPARRGREVRYSLIDAGAHRLLHAIGGGHRTDGAPEHSG